MKEIVKSNEPNSFRDFRLKEQQRINTLEFNALDKIVKDELRTSLIVEQGAICAYCNKRISNDRNKCKIEHFKSRTRHPDLKFDYTNLFAVCYGRTTTSICCDSERSKYDKTIDLSFSLINNTIESQIKYRKNGEIYSDYQDINKDLNKHLNLNDRDLVKVRKDVINKAFIFMRNSKFLKSNLTRLFKQYTNRDRSGKYKPFHMAAVYFINRKLNQHSS